MNEKEKAFCAELEALCTRYGVKIIEHDDYDGDENHAGSHCNFDGPDIHLPIRNLAEP